MRHQFRSVRTFLPVLLAGLAAAPVQAAPQSSPSKPSYYVRVGERGARLFNVADSQGQVVHKAPAGGLLGVHSERRGTGFLEVEAPGGVPVWVFGRYLEPTGQPGVWEVIGDRVLMRPLPSSDVNSFPLSSAAGSQKLFRGDRVRLIARANESLPAAEDWIRVWSPAGTRAWVLSADVFAIARGSDVSEEWTAAAAAAPLALPAAIGATGGAGGAAVDAAAKTGQPGAAAAGSLPPAQEAAKLLAEVEAALSQSADPNAAVDLDAASDKIDRILELVPGSVYATQAERLKRDVKARQELEALRAELEAERERRKAEIDRLQETLDKGKLKQDPLWGRFQARGWMETEAVSADETIYYVRWGGEIIAEVLCTSGRYNLDLFVGHEVGLNGLDLGSSRYTGGGSITNAVKIDVSRMEVISSRLVP